MNHNRVSPGVPAGGQFAAHVRGEADSVLLSNDTPSASTSVAYAHIERLIAREDSDGSVTAVDRQDDVEDDLRSDFPHLSQEEFDQRVGRMVQLAERISVTETADESDTETYEEFGLDYNLEEADFPVAPGEWEPGDSYVDCRAYKTGVIEALEDDLYRETVAFVEANQRAARTQSTASERVAS